MVKILSVIVSTLLLIQYSTGSDPKLDSCIKKFVDQIQAYQFSKPACLSLDKFRGLSQDTKVFAELFEAIPEKCKEPTKDTVKECTNIILDLYNSRGEDVKVALMKSYSSIFGSVQECLQTFKDKVANINQYILNGCEGEL